MKIYIVTSGCYSDYGINIVTTNKEVAENYIKAHSNSDWCDIDYYHLEEYDEYDGMNDDLEKLQSLEHVFKFWGDSIEGIRIDTYLEFYEENSRTTRIESIDPWSAKHGKDYIIIVHTEDLDLAKKIAGDLFAKAEAERLGLI